ncbi:N(2)-fixation sustaining protein CowN [Niveibacterium terrae]|uniref:N(2)-fixation sustaining protein CowN n=1 Tax=Niveibacterium terrae TaxID=3373598 RepID=UPI003A954F70
MDDCGCGKADRYVSFAGIDCAGNARRILEFVDRNLALPGRSNAFWDYFAKKRQGSAGVPQADALLLIHSHLNTIREEFEAWQDEEALALLDQLENECC